MKNTPDSMAMVWVAGRQYDLDGGAQNIRDQCPRTAIVTIASARI
jgi:hypothetical protein